MLHLSDATQLLDVCMYRMQTMRKLVEQQSASVR